MSKLSLESLTVETFATQSLDEASFAVAAKSKNYSECDSCGIACTYVDCPVVSARYTDCGSCGIACTAVEPCV
ncbi:hypothetical protein [Longimicrobium sp.]|uniref:hypothetical protein n=1 Tax=Longimicrobium sp. TaxID=2029185 RepID=UPI002E2F5360|nr:hypothetical protein [Longimicrobium sp.]HEX6039811.1 hypothetical protein [Longimicrobium sp.]